MRQLLLLFALVAAACGAHTPGLRVKWDVGVGNGTTYYIPMPLTLSEAQKDGWTKVQRPAGLPLPSLNLYCPNNDRVLCLFYDDTGYLAGLQIALPQHLYRNAVLDFKTQGYTEWTTVVPGDAKRTYWTLQQYFVSKESSQKKRNERIANRDKNKLLQNDGVWVTSFNGELLKVPGTRSVLETTFLKQRCYPGVGIHYYLWDEKTECTSSKLFTWFPLVHSEELVGVGFTWFGQLPANSLVKDYFERPPARNIKAIAPDAPACLLDLVNNPGAVTMHIYYVNDPWNIDCPLQ